MKRLIFILLALSLTMSAALGENEWKQFESGYCFSLWYDDTRFAVDSWQDEHRGLVERFQFRYENAAAYLEIISLGETDDEEKRWMDQGLTPMDVYMAPALDLALPWEYACYGNDDLTVEEWIVTADNGVFSFVISRPAKDPQHWDEALFSILSTLEFPPQPAVNADMRLDYFQGGAAGMQFIDVVADEGAEPIVLLPLREMKDFALEKIIWDAEALAPLSVEPLYTADTLAPGDNLKIFCYFTDALPDLRVVYTDAEGAAWRLNIFQSGRDGSLLLIPEETFSQAAD